MKSEQYEIVMNSDSAITILFNDVISEALTKNINCLSELFRNNFNELIIDIIPAYQSLTVSFDNEVMRKLLQKGVSGKQLIE